MANPEDEIKLEQVEEGGGRMDKVKKYAGYAGIGFVAGYITAAIIFKDPLWLLPIFFLQMMLEIYIRFAAVIFPILGGLLLGGIFQKWWGAIIGGVFGGIFATSYWGFFIVGAIHMLLSELFS